MSKIFGNDNPNPSRPDYLPDPDTGLLGKIGQLEDPMNVGDQSPLGQGHAGTPLEYGHWTTKPKLGKPSKTSIAGGGAGIPGLPR